MLTCKLARLNYRAPTLDQAHQHCDHCQDKQNMDETAQRVRTDHAQKPKNQQQNGYSPEHWVILSNDA